MVTIATGRSTMENITSNSKWVSLHFVSGNLIFFSSNVLFPYIAHQSTRLTHQSVCRPCAPYWGVARGGEGGAPGTRRSPEVGVGGLLSARAPGETGPVQEEREPEDLLHTHQTQGEAFLRSIPPTFKGTLHPFALSFVLLETKSYFWTVVHHSLIFLL